MTGLLVYQTILPPELSTPYLLPAAVIIKIIFRKYGLPSVFRPGGCLDYYSSSRDHSSRRNACLAQVLQTSDESRPRQGRGIYQHVTDAGETSCSRHSTYKKAVDTTAEAVRDSSGISSQLGEFISSSPVRVHLPSTQSDILSEV